MAQMLHIVILRPTWVGHEPRVSHSIVEYSFVNHQSKFDLIVTAYNYSVEGKSLICVQI